MTWFAIYDGAVDKYVAQLAGTFSGRIAHVHEDQGETVERHGKLFTCYKDAARHINDANMYVTAEGCYVAPVTR